MRILINNAQRDLSIPVPWIRKIIRALLYFFRIKSDLLYVQLVGAKKIAAVHGALFGDYSFTNCITQPIDSIDEKTIGPHLLGEIFICPKAAMVVAQGDGSFMWEELVRYCAHCLLHLSGYEDKTVQGQRRMRKKELQALSFLRRRDLLHP